MIGNPVGLFSNVSSGVVDMFYEPILGFEITRPQDFGIGVAKGRKDVMILGTASFFKKTIFSLSDTVSKVTGSIGKGKECSLTFRVKAYLLLQWMKRLWKIDKLPGREIDPNMLFMVLPRELLRLSRAWRVVLQGLW